MLNGEIALWPTRSGHRNILDAELVRATSITANRSHRRVPWVQSYPCNCWGFDMPNIHFHVWHYKRDPGGVIRSMERHPERYDKRRPANRALEMFRRKHCIAGQVLQCVDGAFCQPPPDWVVQGYTLGGAVAVGTEYFIDWTPSIRPSRKMELGMENLADYVQENPDLVVRRPSHVQ